jgi:hypothetical protein
MSTTCNCETLELEKSCGRVFLLHTPHEVDDGGSL